FTFTTPDVAGTYSLILENTVIGNIQGENILTGTIDGTLTLTGPTSFTVTFVVKDENQVVIPDATVTLGTIANPAGNYVFPNTDIGNYEWEVVKDGYVSANGSVTVVDQDVEVNVTMTPVVTNNIMMVLDATGEAGDDVIIDLEIVNDESFVGFQFDIPLPVG